MSTEKTDPIKKLWNDLSACDPDAVCRRAQASYNATTDTYQINSFGLPITVDVAATSLACEAPEGDRLLGRFAYFSHLSLLHYLTYAPGLQTAGRFVSPTDLSSGQIYFRGSHILPTAGLAAGYNNSLSEFKNRGSRLGATPLNYGDAALQLDPLPRVPVAIVLWCGDDEFPARASFLIDAGCEQQVAPDIVWAVAMLSVLIMMPE